MAPKLPVLKLSVANATVLSGLYLLIALGVELVRRVWSPPWAERLSLRLEEFPARVLHLFGLFAPLRQAFQEGQLSELQVRLIYGATVVASIFAMGLIVGCLMWLGSLALAREDRG